MSFTNVENIFLVENRKNHNTYRNSACLAWTSASITWSRSVCFLNNKKLTTSTTKHTVIHRLIDAMMTMFRSNELFSLTRTKIVLFKIQRLKQK